MIKFETIGEIQRSVNNPVIKLANDVANYSFVTVDNDLYLIAMDGSGDDMHKEGLTFAAGELLRGFLVKALESQNLIVDGKHITYGVGKTYADLKVADAAHSVDATILTVAQDGTLEIAAEAPDSGIYFVVVEKCTLTEAAVKVKVCVVDALGE